MRTFNWLLFFLFGVGAFGAPIDPVDFATRCANLWIEAGDKSLEAFVLPKQNSDLAEDRMSYCWAKLKVTQSSGTSPRDLSLKALSIKHIYFRDPAQDFPRKIVFSRGEEAETLAKPDKIAVIYLANSLSTVRGVIIFPLVQRDDRYWIVPMRTVGAQNASADKVQPPINASENNISKCAGVVIVKTGEDRSSYGFPPPANGETADRVFRTNDRGCTLVEVLRKTLDGETWIFGLDSLPKGRFKVVAELSQDENVTISEKVQAAILKTFNLQLNLVSNYEWSGYRVTVPKSLPESWRKSAPEGGRLWKGEGVFGGHTLKEIIYHAIPDKPVEIIGPLNEQRFDVTLDVWPEAGGEMEALKQAGIAIEPARISHRTAVISLSSR